MSYLPRVTWCTSTSLWRNVLLRTRRWRTYSAIYRNAQIPPENHPAGKRKRFTPRPTRLSSLANGSLLQLRERCCRYWRTASLAARKSPKRAKGSEGKCPGSASPNNKAHRIRKPHARPSVGRARRGWLRGCWPEVGLRSLEDQECGPSHWSNARAATRSRSTPTRVRHTELARPAIAARRATVSARSNHDQPERELATKSHPPRALTPVAGPSCPTRQRLQRLLIVGDSNIEECWARTRKPVAHCSVEVARLPHNMCWHSIPTCQACEVDCWVDEIHPNN